eukprot:NODE_186_length_15678_cov_0.309262.p9 type:complete len:117 gc:universal NODE_186_length_15678_cov_0.309262:6496-6846(+)
MGSTQSSTIKAESVKYAADRKAEAIYKQTEALEFVAKQKADILKDAASYQFYTNIGIILATSGVAGATLVGAYMGFRSSRLNHQRDRTFKLVELMKDTITGRPHEKYSEGMVKIYN